jgi:hypothetical protein
VPPSELRARVLEPEVGLRVYLKLNRRCGRSPAMGTAANKRILS